MGADLDWDLLLLVGVLFLPLSAVSIVAAWADRRKPWAGGILLGLGGTLIALAQLAHPLGYQPADLPEIFFTTLARYWH
jgi:hypothetical protein